MYTRPYCIDVVAVVVVVVEINSIQFNSNKVYINWSLTAFGRIFQHGANKCQVKLMLVFAIHSLPWKRRPT